MMIFTAAAAVLCTGARALQSTTQAWLLMTLITVICFVAVALISLWAALGDARSLRRGPAVFVLSLALGAYLAVPATAAGRVYILLITLLYADGLT